MSLGEWLLIQADPIWLSERLERSGEGLTLETSAFKLFTVANLRFQLCW